MTDEQGKIVWSARYEAFGRASVKMSDNYRNPIRFQGQYEDEETGLHYNYHRYYDPKLGRYLSKDPIGLAGGVNLRGYVGGNVAGAVDAKGLQQIHGNWCGPDWTGGRVEEYSAQRDRGNYYLQPLPNDPLDAACKSHDIEYYKCRIAHPCDRSARKTCMDTADKELQHSANNIAASQRWTPQDIAYASKARVVGNAVGFNPLPPVGDNLPQCPK